MDVMEKATNDKRLIDVNDIYSLFNQNGIARLHVSDIDKIPRVDSVEVVRCEKCVLHRKCFTENVFVFAGIKNPFCCAGKRKEGAD